ncbi:terpene synthase-like [Zophobas morio]|uniref:terpene synthase-like n=1 Tax=Zophobas morio TaxID=2755281 RepID=UPI0030829A75
MAASNKSDPQSQEEEILARPIKHVSQPGSETLNLWKRSIHSYNFWIKCPKDAQKIFADFSDTAYDIFIVVDDLEDETKLRRGISSAHEVYGVPLTVQAVVYMACKLSHILTPHLEKMKHVAVDHFIQMGIQSFTGQGLEIYFRDIQKCPTFDDYRTIVRGKSSHPVMWGIQLLKLLAKKETTEFNFDVVDKLCYFLQIYNDYINLHNTKYATVRVFCDDLDEGKFSYPIIHAIRSHPNDRRLLDLLKKRPLDMETKKLFVNIMDSFGSFEYTRNALEDLKNEIRADLEKTKVEKNPLIERIFHDVFSSLDNEIYFDGLFRVRWLNTFGDVI